MQFSAVVKDACPARNQSDCNKIMQILLSTNQIAAFAHLHKQNGVIWALFVVDQSEGRKSDHVTCHATEHVQMREKTGS